MVYSKTLPNHIGHLRLVLETLAKHQLYAKQSKCMFACDEVEYLGHLISGKGVRIDPKKTTTMQQWLVPKDVKALKGFLGLTRYYRKFVKRYGQIAAPLTALLKNDSFVWTSEVLYVLYYFPLLLGCLILRAAMILIPRLRQFCRMFRQVPIVL